MQKINPNHELFKWGPIDGRLVYVDFFNVAFPLYQKEYYSWPDMVLYYNNEKVTFILDYPELRDCGEVNFRRYILNDKKFRTNYSKWNRAVADFKKFQKIINTKLVAELSRPGLDRLFGDWRKKYLRFWVIGQLPELANWGGEEILKKELKKKIPAADFNWVFEKLSAPEYLSFYQKAELELLKLRSINDPKTLGNKLASYQATHFWILNNYHHPRMLSKEYFKKELKNYSPEAAWKKIEELENWSRKVQREKKEIIKKFKLDKNIAKISERLAFCIWWQDARKFYIFLANHQINIFLKRYAREYGMSKNDLADYSYSELLSLIKNNKKLTSRQLRDRRVGLVAYYTKSSNAQKYFSGNQVKKFIAPYLEIKINKSIKEIKGLVVSGGENIRAKVKILTSPKEASKLKKGEILVAAMTSPDYITAIKKASAIITDEGGMTCHAAIVSRELKIPCIVATKIATQILRDGDLVEVDAEKGIVRKFKSN